MYRLINHIDLSPKSEELIRENFDVPNGMLDGEVVLVPTGMYYGREFIDKNSSLKIIASNTTSDQHIDTEYCKEKGIQVITLAGDPILQDITAVAELTICFMIMLTRNVFPAMKSVSRETWDRYPCGGRKMLKNMTVGIVGMGRLGQMVKHLIPIDMKYKYFNSKFGSKHNKIFKYLNVLKQDIVTVHIPLEGNERLFNAEVFGQFKDGAYFINTSRGEIVDEQALVDALESGKLAGAATDVLAGEFEPDFDLTKNPLWQYAQGHNNLLITPHIGGSTEDAWEMTQVRIIEKVLEVLE